MKNLLILGVFFLTIYSLNTVRAVDTQQVRPELSDYTGENNPLLKLDLETANTEDILLAIINNIYHASGEEKYLVAAIQEFANHVVNTKQGWTNLYKQYNNIEPNAFQARFLMRTENDKIKFSQTLDYLGNLVIRLPGTGKYFNKDFSLSLQAHTDMVLDHESGLSGDKLRQHFFKGVPTEIDSQGWLRSKGVKTSLGADNTTGVAEMLMFLLSPDYERPALELVFTMGEEADWHLDQHKSRSYIYGSRFGNQQLASKVLINIDSHKGVNKATMGSVGGEIFTVTKSFKPVKIEGRKLLRIVLNGLVGGHTGNDIHLNRKVAPIIIAKYLAKNSKTIGDYNIVSFSAGTSSKSKIPSKSEIILSVPNTLDISIVKKNAQESIYSLLSEKNSRGDDSEDAPEINENIDIVVEWIDETNLKMAMSHKDSKEIINKLSVVKNGVFTFLDDGYFPEGVKSSFNHSILQLALDSDTNVFQLKIDVLARSLVADEFTLITDYLQSFYSVSDGYDHTQTMGWPSWEVDTSKDWLAKLLKSKIPDLSISATNGGLEPNMILANHKTNLGISMPVGSVSISIGPEFNGLHSFNEKIKWESINKSFEQTSNIIKLVGEKLYDQL